MEIALPEIVLKAGEAKEKAYAPYSNFKVGAAVITKCGTIFTGCNIENACYPCGNCAERTAIFKAVSEGYTKLKAIAIVGNTDAFLTPCGLCRQTMKEFSSSMEVYCAKSDYSFKKFTLDELIPDCFGTEDLHR